MIIDVVDWFFKERDILDNIFLESSILTDCQELIKILTNQTIGRGRVKHDYHDNGSGHTEIIY